MKRQNRTIEYLVTNIIKHLIILVGIIVVGCTPNDTSSTQIMSDEIVKPPTIEITTTTILTITPAPNLLQISEPTKIITSFSTAIISPAVIATPTTIPQTSFPTLTIAEREMAHQSFMLADEGCILPCWWGIELGASLESVDQKFTNLGLPWMKIEHSDRVESDQMGVFLSGYIDEDGTRPIYRLSTYTEVHEFNDSVSYIYTRVKRPNSEKAQQEFVRDWEQYYLSSFLQMFGKPTRVYFHVSSIADLMLPPRYTIILLYSEKGIAIAYQIEGKWLDEKHNRSEVCLDMGNLREVELSLFIPDQFERWKPQILPLSSFVKPGTYDETWTWADSFDISLDTFYETYQDTNNLGCLYIND